MLKRTVEIDSKEFEQKVLRILEKSKRPSRKFPLLELRNDPDRFKLLPDGFVLDRLCKLERGPTSPNRMTKSEATAYANTMGCFLEEVEELESLIDRSVDPCILSNYPGEIKTDGHYWTNTPTPCNKNAYYCVSFDNGHVINYYGNSLYYVCPVRAIAQDYVGKCPECNKFGHIKLRCESCEKGYK